NPEVWKEVVGYEGFYKVSNYGRVKSIKRSGTSGGYMKLTHDDKGYIRIPLNKNGVTRNKLVHRLVAKSFLDRVKGKNEINHINGVTDDNRVNNLEWCNRSENMKHAYKMGLQKPDMEKPHKIAHQSIKRKVAKYTLDGELVRVYDSIKDGAKSIGTKDGTHISAVARGRRGQTGGFKWEYI